MSDLLKDKDLRPGLADSDPELKAWLDAPEQAYNRFKSLDEARAYAVNREAQRAQAMKAKP